jgi:hypothetical protein
MYDIRLGPKNLSKNGHLQTNSRKIISSSTEIHNPSARGVTSDLALDPNKLNIVKIVKAEAVYTEVGRKAPLSPLLSIF